MKNGSFILFRVLGTLLVLGLIAGAGAFGYKAGMAQGISQAPAVAKAIEKAAEDGQVIPQMMYQRSIGYGYYPMSFHHHGFFNPIGAICFSILFLFLFFGAMKMIFFRGMWRPGPWAYGPHGHPWGTPPWMRPEGNEKKEEAPEEKK